MHSYIINLKQSLDRRSHMESEMKKMNVMDYEFVDAVYGKAMTQGDVGRLFDVKKAEKKYARSINFAEIGCTLSHQKCYRKLVSDKLPYVIIFEDDVMFHENIENKLETIRTQIDSEQPIIVLLSGMYWFFPLQKGKNKNLVKIFNAYLTSSYVINNAAARLMIEDRPYMRADDWRYVMRKGIQIYAFHPHIVDQDWSGTFKSTIYENNKIDKFSIYAIYSHIIALIMKFLKAVGGYEYAGENRNMN